MSAQRRNGVKHRRSARQSENDVRCRIIGAGDVDPPIAIVTPHAEHRRDPTLTSVSERPLIQRFKPFMRSGEQLLVLVRVAGADDHLVTDVHQTYASNPTSVAEEGSVCLDWICRTGWGRAATKTT